MDEDFNLFEESEPTTEPIEATDDPTNEQAEKPTETNPEPQKFKVKVNKEEKELTLDEMIAAAQKGMDYDRVKGQVESLRNNPALTLLERKAKEANMPLDQYVDFLNKAEQQAKVDERKQQLIDEGYDEKIAEHVANLELKANGLESTVNNLTAQTKEQQQIEAQMKADIDEFFRECPDVDVRTLPKEVLDMMNGGVKPVVAYLKYQNDLKEKELSALKQNNKNAELDPGSAQTQKPDEGDEFVSELFRPL